MRRVSVEAKRMKKYINVGTSINRTTIIQVETLKIAATYIETIRNFPVLNCQMTCFQHIRFMALNINFLSQKNGNRMRVNRLMSLSEFSSLIVAFQSTSIQTITR
ncbi:CLUMA_CG021482, isoform A [Clunio marinus]|uniref:CLUMA_CG021482, isoform A n=1 Tax=Clunio marinus TaxID=568069 RepID=A0A1J1J7Q5_9DIPT|nr:CLUMA_CG021482, isoform A [Clunio marinus]